MSVGAATERKQERTTAIWIGGALAAFVFKVQDQA